MMTAPFDIFLGIFLWALAMVMPMLLIYVKNAEFKSVMLTLIYPNMLAFLARSGRFWVSQRVIIMASIAAFLLSLTLRAIPSVKKALDDPSADVARSAGVMSALVSFFFIVMAAISFSDGMYNSN